jgi:hypothetical protein
VREGRHDVRIDNVASSTSPLTNANLKRFVLGGATARAAQDKLSRCGQVLAAQHQLQAKFALLFILSNEN